MFVVRLGTSSSIPDYSKSWVEGAELSCFQQSPLPLPTQFLQHSETEQCKKPTPTGVLPFPQCGAPVSSLRLRALKQNSEGGCARHSECEGHNAAYSLVLCALRRLEMS